MSSILFAGHIKSTRLITDKEVEGLTCPSQLVSPPTTCAHKCSVVLPPTGERQCALSS